MVQNPWSRRMYFRTTRLLAYAYLTRAYANLRHCGFQSNINKLAYAYPTRKLRGPYAPRVLTAARTPNEREWRAILNGNDDIPYHITSYHIVSYHIISHHTIPFHSTPESQSYSHIQNPKPQSLSKSKPESEPMT